MTTPPGTFSMDTIRDLLAKYPELPAPRQSIFASRGFADALSTMFPLGRDEERANPIYAGSMSYLGIPIRTYDIPKQKVYDWSGCRSPSRARRRHARGIPQRVEITEVDVAYMVNEDALRLMQLGWECTSPSSRSSSSTAPVTLSRSGSLYRHCLP